MAIDRGTSADRFRRRRRSGLAPLFVTAGFFAVVLAVLFFTVKEQPTSPDSNRTAGISVEESRTAQNRVASVSRTVEDEPAASSQKTARTVGQKTQPKETQQQTSAITPAETTDRTETASAGKLDEPPTKATANATEENTAFPSQKSHRKQSPQERVRQQLADGDFAGAWQTAQNVADEQTRRRLVTVIAQAQKKAGQFEAAFASLRPQRSSERLSSAKTTAEQQQSLTGGGSGADFDSLIDLIMQETSGPWFEEEGVGGTISEFETGIRADPNRVLGLASREGKTGRMHDLRLRTRQARPNEEVTEASSLRLVALSRLERAIADRLAEDRQPTQAMKYLAGLTRVRYVFLAPEAGEILIGGPAEPWEFNENGPPLGETSGRPVLRLDDLVTVLRTFSPKGDSFFNCLIVPRQEGLKRVKQFVARSTGPLRPGRVGSWVEEIQNRLGVQDVEINGVPRDSRVARIMLQADYRMKLIGIGKRDGGPGIPSFFDLLALAPQQNPPKMDALRWWLTMQYESILHSPDDTVFELQGSSVLCRSENEIITEQGERVHTGKAETTNRLFAERFTKHYARLSRRDPVFAELQNIFDLAMVAALIRQEELDRRANWSRGIFARNGGYEPASYEPTETVDSAVNYRVYNGKDIVVQVAGGIRVDALAALKDSSVRRDLPQPARLPELPTERWWWDAAE